MDLNKIRETVINLLLFLICIPFFLQSANIPVHIDNPIYGFLQRMENRGVISGYSGMELPLNRDEIATYLEEIESSRGKLNSIEKKLYTRYCSYYYLELDEAARLHKTEVKFINSGTPGNTFGDVFSRDVALREQHLISYEDENEFLWLDVGLQAQNQSKNDWNRQLIYNQMLLRGGFKQRVSAFVQFDQYLKLNADKYNEPLPEEKGRLVSEGVHFSNTYSGISYSGDYLDFGLYQQPFLWGASRENNLTFSNNGPPFPYFRLAAEVGWLKYTLLHGGLVNDSTNKKYKDVNPANRDMTKNVAAQRFEISLFGGHTYLGFNQMVIYCNRTLEWSYLVPLNFYFSAEHYLEDRDNALMSFDIKSKIFKNTEAYATLFLDELKWSELGSQWWGNKQAVQAGLRYHSYLFKRPTNFQLEYTAVRPWTYTHDTFNNNYTNDRFGLGFPYGPNSELYYFSMDTYFTWRLKSFFKYKYLRHGENYGSEATANYADRNPIYEHSTKWLMGEIHTTEQIEFGLQYEYFNDCYLFGSVEYRITSNAREKDDILTNFGMSLNL